MDLRTDQNHSRVGLRTAYIQPAGSEFRSSYNGSNNPSSAKASHMEGGNNILGFENLAAKHEYNKQGSSILFQDQQAALTIRDIPSTENPGQQQQQQQQHLKVKGDRIRMRIQQKTLTASEDGGNPESGRAGATPVQESQTGLMRNSFRMRKSVHQSEGNSGQTVNLKLLTVIRKQVMHFFLTFTTLGRNHLYSNEYVRDYINDKSDFLVQQRGGYFKRKGMLFVDFLLQKMDFCLRRIPLLDPDSSWYFAINFAYSSYHTLFFVFFTLVNVFDAPLDYNTMLSQVTFGVWVTEILIRLNTKVRVSDSQQTRKQLMNKANPRREIVKEYIMHYSFFDLIPLLFVVLSPTQDFQVRSIMQMIVGFKLRNMQLQIDEVQRFLCMTFKDYYLIQLANLVIKMFIIGHIIACMWYLVGYSEVHFFGAEATWFDEGVGKDYTWWKLYLEAIFWSLTLMTTGSNVATTVAQLFFTTVIMIFTTIVFGYMLQVIGFILEEMDKKNESKRRDLNLINEYMRSKKTSKQLQQKINVDLEYFYEKNFKKIEEDNQEILAKISSNLNESLKKEYNRELMAHIPIINTNFSEKAIDELANVIEELAFFPNQFIYSEADTKDLSLIFIVNGKVEISQGRTIEMVALQQLYTLKSSDIFGEIGFFTGTASMSSIKAVDFTKVIKIRRDKFIAAIESFEKDKETFFQIKDRISMYKNFNDINLKCEICSQKTHRELECPFVHPNKAPCVVKDIFTKSKDAVRKSCVRGGHRLRALLKQGEIQEIAQLFLEENHEEFEATQGGEGEEAGEIEFSKNSMVTSFQSQDNIEEEEDGQTDQLLDDLGQHGASVSQAYQMNQSMVSSRSHKERFATIIPSQFKEESFMLLTGEQQNLGGTIPSNSPKVLAYNDRNKYFTETISSNLNLDSTPESKIQMSLKVMNGFSERYLLLDRANERRLSNQTNFLNHLDDENFTMELSKTSLFNVMEASKNNNSQAPPVMEPSKYRQKKATTVRKTQVHNTHFRSEQQQQQQQQKKRLSEIHGQGGQDRDQQILLSQLHPQLQQNHQLTMRQIDGDAADKDSIRVKEPAGSVIIWELDKLFDYKYYFSSGNSKRVIVKFGKIQRKNNKVVKIHIRKK